MGATVAYTCREQVKRALDVRATAIADDRIDAHILAASEAIEGELHKRFYPWHGTVSIDWPNWTYSSSWRLWLDPREVISLSAVTSGGDTLDPADYFLTGPGPVALAEPPYNVLAIDQSSSATFNAGTTWQRAVQLTGVWNHGNDTTPAGALTASLTDSATTATVTNGSLTSGVRTLDLIKIDSEYMIVTERAPVDTGQTLATALTATNNDQAVAVLDSTGFYAGEQITIDAETMLITRVLVGVLVVKRAWDGSTLAAHSLAAPIYADRALTLQRGAVGTTAAVHADDAPILRHRPPDLVQALARAHSINSFLQEGSGYAMTTGSGDNEREATGKALASLWEQACKAYGIEARAGAV